MTRFRRCVHGLLAIYVALIALWHADLLFNRRIPPPRPLYEHAFLAIVGFRIALLLASDAAKPRT